jgi:transcriptional regulator with XRE-family HTH domain
MDADETIRERIRKAREDLNWSQTDLARLLDVSQATVSDIERGRVPITANQLARCATLLKMPIEYFFPAELTAIAKSNSEAELLTPFRLLPGKWQQRALYEMKRLLSVYEDIKPYEQAGIPEEYYEKLMWYLDEWQKDIEFREAEEAGKVISGKEEIEFSKRFHEWLAETEKRLRQ